MRRRSRVVLSLLTVSLLIAASQCLLVVDETQFVIVTDFGRPVTLYGDAAGESGPHAKWPWQTAIALDRRVQVRELPPRELITGDRRNIEVSAFLVWRVVDPERTMRAAGTPEAAAARLEERAASALSLAVGRRPLDALASVDPSAWKLDALSEEAADEVRKSARSDLGLELVSLGLRRFRPPLEVRPAIFERIRSERKLVSETLRAEAEASYRVAVAQAESERTVTLADAESKAQAIRAEAEAEATRILNAAQSQDEEFAALLRSIELMQALLDEEATLILSTSSPLLKHLRGELAPTPGGGANPTEGRSGPAAGEAR